MTTEHSITELPAPSDETLDEAFAYDDAIEQVVTPLWREARWGLEWASLRMNPVYYGVGIPRGHGQPVLLIRPVDPPLIDSRSRRDLVAADVVTACAEHGVLVGTAGPETLRITPPLTITAEDFGHGLAVLEEVLVV